VALANAGAAAAGRAAGGRSDGGATGPAAGTGGRSTNAAGRGGGGGSVTIRRASALISAMDRVSGRNSWCVSAGFFTAVGAGAGAAVTGAAVSGAAVTGAGATTGGAASSCASGLTARKCSRTLSATSSSSALECDRLSVIPSSGRQSKIALLLTSSSRARSLIRILPISPLFLSRPNAVTDERPPHAALHAPKPYFTVLRLLHRARTFPARL
jgi:hypothetical protein